MTIDCIEKYTNGARNGTKSVYIFITLALSLKDDKSMVHGLESIRSCSRRKMKEYHGNNTFRVRYNDPDKGKNGRRRWKAPKRHDLSSGGAIWNGGPVR